MVNAPDHHPALPTAYTDSDWAGNLKHRKSVTGYVVYMAGGPVLYKSRLQPTVSLSSTEAEFVAATDTGKSILYLRSILEELDVPVHQATDLYIDNAGARMMGNSLKPTKRTRHLDIKHFALLEWTENDLIMMKPVSTNNNSPDMLTKALGKQLFARHKATLMGHRKPQWALKTHVSTTVNLNSATPTIQRHRDLRRSLASHHTQSKINRVFNMGGAS